MIFQFPQPRLSRDFIKIHQELKRQGILGDYGRRLTFPDEPQFFQYACERYPGTKRRGKISFGFGCSDDQSEAFVIAVAEAIEHYCILSIQKSKLLRDTYEHLRERAIDPLRFLPFSTEQLKQEKFTKFRFDHKTPLNWLQGYSLTTKRKVLVPASVVYAKYDAVYYDEPVIQLPNNTGAACGESLEFALCRGIYEVVERDAYMISFVRNLPKRMIDVSQDDGLSQFKRRIERYALEVYFLLTALDYPMPTIACLILDRTGSGPAVCTGLGGHRDIRHAIRTAGFEAVRRHISARDRFFRTIPLPMPQKYSFDWFLLEKQRLWSMPHMIAKAETFLGSDTISLQDSLGEFSMASHSVTQLVDRLKQLNCEAIMVDVTVPEVEAVGLKVIKVLIPEMVPLWRDERYPYLGIDRLITVPTKMGYSSLSPVVYDDAFTIHPF